MGLMRNRETGWLSEAQFKNILLEKKPNMLFSCSKIHQMGKKGLILSSDLITHHMFDLCGHRVTNNPKSNLLIYQKSTLPVYTLILKLNGMKQNRSKSVNVESGTLDLYERAYI